MNPIDRSLLALYREVIAEEGAHGIDMAPESFEPFTVTAGCGECGKRVKDGSCCQECHHGCEMPGNDCPGRG